MELLFQNGGDRAGNAGETPSEADGLLLLALRGAREAFA